MYGRIHMGAALQNSGQPDSNAALHQGHFQTADLQV